MEDRDQKSENEDTEQGRKHRFAWKNSYKEELQDFTANTTLHGMKQATNQESIIPRRLLWSLLLLGSFSFFLYMCITRLSYYYVYPTSTRLTVKTERPIDFPAVTLCNQNKYKKSVATKSNVTAHVFRAAFLTLQGTPVPINWSDPILKQWDDNINIYDLSYEAHHNMSMFLQCQWESQLIPCNDYFSMTLTNEGFCYTFHSQKFIEANGTLKVYQTGSDHGLRIRGIIEQDEYYYGTQASAGMKILAHNPKNKPQMKEMGAVISPGAESFLSLTKYNIIRLPPPFDGGFCNDTTSPTFKNPVKHEEYYSMSACRQECEANYTMNECGCLFYYQKTGNWGNVSICSIRQSAECAIRALMYYAQHNLELSCDCVDPCNIVGYTMSVTSAKLPAKHLLPELSNLYQEDRQWFSDNLFDLRIFYEELNYDVIEQVAAYDMSAFGGDVGGYIGLFLGASVLTVCEFIEFFLLSIKYLLIKRPSVRQKP